MITTNPVSVVFFDVDVWLCEDSYLCVYCVYERVVSLFEHTELCVYYSC